MLHSVAVVDGACLLTRLEMTHFVQPSKYVAVKRTAGSSLAFKVIKQLTCNYVELYCKGQIQTNSLDDVTLWLF